MLALLAKSKEESAEDSESAARAGDDSQRLGLARQLLAEGDVEHAVQFAEPALTRADEQTVGFLMELREKDAGRADRLYAALLARAEADPAADANAVSALMSYVFTPYTFFNVSRGGGTGTSTTGGDAESVPEMSAGLRANLLRAAARILLRPQTAEDYALTSSGRTGAYVIIRRLLPFFDQYAPELAAALNARAAMLAADVPEGTRRVEAAGEYAYRPRREEEEAAPRRDRVQEALDRAERTTGVEQRDEIYASAALTAASRGDARADDLLAKINDPDLARGVRRFIDFSFVQNSLGKKEAEPATARARKGELTPFERAWAYESAAEIVSKADRDRALSLLEDAAEEARRIDNTDPDRARALLAVATRYAKFDRPRAWQFLAEAARAANSAPAFTGDDGKVVVQFRTKHSASMTDFNAEEFDLADVLAALADDDWNRAVQLAQSLTGEAARTTAVVALARAALLKKGAR
jgi:hypothetical protein